MTIRLRDLLATFIVLLVLSPLTAPFAAYDLTGHHDFTKPQSDLLAAKTCVDEETALLGAVPVAPGCWPAGQCGEACRRVQPAILVGDDAR